MTKNPSPEPPVFRFAPSPNGELHLGHAYSALVNAELAKKSGGRLLLRIEDIDKGRSRARFSEQIFDDLAWLGLTWETPVRRQSEHFEDYARATALLDALGVLYPCFASRSEIAAATGQSVTPARDPEGAPLYPGLHKNLTPSEIARRRASGEKPALRVDMPVALALLQARGALPLMIDSFAPDGSRSERPADPGRWGDAVIVRKDVPASYHLAVVVDDALQGVTHVVRGADLEAATDLHRLLQAQLDLPAPRYYHHPLITDPACRKLAKSLRDTSLRSLREQGMTPAAIRAQLPLP